MSITSSNNLAVNNSLSVNGNTILGTNSANTLICNATTTFNNPLTLNGNFVQNSGTLSTTSDTNYLNGNVIINGSKTFTTGSGLTTINGITQANHDVKILTGASLYVSNASLTKYLRVHHDLINSYIDYVGDMILRKSGTTTAMSIASSDNKATFPYGVITNEINVSGTAYLGTVSCSSITNSGIVTTSNLEISSPTTPAYIDMKTTGNNLDFDVRIAASGGVVGTPGQGTMTISAASTIVNSPLNVNSSVNCTSINNSGQLTQTGGDVVLSSGRSVYVTDGATNYVRLHHSGTTSALDFTGGLSVRNGGSTIPLTISSSNNEGTFNYNLNTANGITNSNAAIINNSTLTQVGLASFSNNIKVNTGGFVYVSDAGLTNYVGMHHNGSSSYLDFTGGLYVRNGGSTTSLSINSSNNQGTFSNILNTTGITNNTNALVNNGVFTQNNTSTFSSAITAPSITSSGTFHAGSSNNFDTTAISSPKVINGIASGTADGATYSNFNLAINSWNGVGFVYSNPAAPSVCKLVINNRTGNISTQGDITCNSVIASTALTIPSVVSNGSIYMANANPIYLKSVADANHYIKYDEPNEGPQLGFYGSTTMKCTENNEIMMKVSKTDVELNASTTITGNCAVSNKLTVGNGMVLNGAINQSKYFTLKGYTNNNSNPTTYYLYTKFDGTIGGAASETFQMQSGCVSAKITYTYNSTYSGNIFQGAREYMIYGEDYTGIATVWSAGSTNYPPVITCTGYGLITIEFPKNTALTGSIYWSFAILMI